MKKLKSSHKSKSKLIVALVLLLTVIIGLPLFFINKNRKKTELLESINNDLNNNTTIISDDTEALRDIYSEKNIKGLLSEKEISETANKFWSYELNVNGENLDSASITLPPGDITIVLVENEKPRILPVEIHKSGSVSIQDNADYFYENLKFKKHYGFSVKSENLKKSAIFPFFDIKSGQSIEISLTDSIRNKLKLSFNEIVIKIQE